MYSKVQLNLNLNLSHFFAAQLGVVVFPFVAEGGEDGVG